MTVSGANRVLTMELRSGQIQGFFDIPVDHISCNDVFQKYIDTHIVKMYEEPLVVVSSCKRATARASDLAAKLNVSWAVVDGRREIDEDEERMKASASAANLVSMAFVPATPKKLDPRKSNMSLDSSNFGEQDMYLLGEIFL